MKHKFLLFGTLVSMLFMTCALQSCNESGDETISLEYGYVKKMIIGVWVLEGGTRVLTFTDDGYYTDSSDGGRYRWRLGDDYKENEPYYGGIYLNSILYKILSFGDGRWVLVNTKTNQTWVLIKDGGEIGKEEEVDNRIDDVVPQDIQNKMGSYIPIYRGKNPPNIEGVYVIQPMTTVYCEDQNSGGYKPGTVMTHPTYIRFSNFRSSNNTLDYEGTNGESNTATGRGAFVSGSGNNFTAYFNTTGQSEGISYKTALVISGTKSSSGIKNIRYAFVMVDKGNDPKPTLMAKGVYRVFKDGDELASTATWPLRTRNMEDDLNNIWAKFIQNINN